MFSAGIVVINKEKGFTSHDVVAIVKKTLQMKAGHTGTLDPQAEGVLPVVVGRATKLSDFLMTEDKTYLAEVVLGITTDTYDTTGEVLTRRDVTFNEEQIRETVVGFIGEQKQVPPMYSAIKVKGKKLYELAREGKTVKRPTRTVFIHDIRIVSLNPVSTSFYIEVKCSKGTYIRSLCADIGEKLGCGACMGALTRTQTGKFSINNAVTLSIFKENPGTYIRSVEEVLPYPRAYLMNTQAITSVRSGNPVISSNIGYTVLGYEKYWLYSGNQLIGLYKRDKKDGLVPEIMML